MERSLTVLLTLSTTVLIIGSLASIWKRGKWGIILISFSGTIVFIAGLFSYYVEKGYLGAEQLFAASLLYLFFMFFLGTKHVMKIGIFDLRSYEDYKTYLKDNHINGVFPIFLLYLGPVLLLCAFGLLIVDIARRLL